MTLLFIIVTLGYTFKENSACDGLSDEKYASLEEALDNCNSNYQCKCIDYSKGGNKKYFTYTSGTKGYYPICDAWVITAI